MLGKASPVLLLLAPILLSGCVAEPISVALRVPAGREMTLSDSRSYDGSIVVEPGGTLVLEAADIQVAQALLVQGTLVARDSTIVFAGDYQRQTLEIFGNASFERTTLKSLAGVTLVSGSLLMEGGELDSGCVDLVSGRALARNASWSVGTQEGCPVAWSWNTPGGFRIESADATFAGGAVKLARNTNGIETWSGTLRLHDVTLDASAAAQTFFVRDGLVEANRTRFVARDLGEFATLLGGEVKLLDSPYPRNARLPSVSEEARLSVSWTLTVRAVDAIGGAPVANATVSLTGAHAVEAYVSGVTDDKGEVRLPALQYVYAYEESRSGNPQMVRAVGAGRNGAAPAVVVEGPSSVTVPLLGPGLAVGPLARVTAR